MATKKTNTFTIASKPDMYGRRSTERFTVFGMGRVLIDDNAGSPFDISIESARNRWRSWVAIGWSRLEG